MAYHEGDAVFGSVDIDDREEDGYSSKEFPCQAIHLPHSCDKWVIGDVREARLLIKDLQGIIKELG